MKTQTQDVLGREVEIDYDEAMSTIRPAGLTKIAFAAREIGRIYTSGGVSPPTRFAGEQFLKLAEAAEILMVVGGMIPVVEREEGETPEDVMTRVLTAGFDAVPDGLMGEGAMVVQDQFNEMVEALAEALIEQGYVMGRMDR